MKNITRNHHFFLVMCNHIFMNELSNSRLSISFVQIADTTPSIAGPTIYRSSANGPSSAILMVEDAGQYSKIEWYIKGMSRNGGSFTLNVSDSAYNSPGEHTIMVEVVKDDVPYSRAITFTVAD